MKKKFMSLMVAGAMALSLAGCKGGAATPTAAAGAEAESGAEKGIETAAGQDEEVSQGKGEDLEATGGGEAGGTFIVGFDQDFPPMGFVGDDGEYTGFDLELAEEAANRLGLEFVPQIGRAHV